MATQIIARTAAEYFRRRADTNSPAFEPPEKPPPAPLKGADRVVVVAAAAAVAVAFSVVVIVRAAADVQIRNRKSEANPFEHAAATDTCRRPLAAGEVFAARAVRYLPAGPFAGGRSLAGPAIRYGRRRQQVAEEWSALCRSDLIG